MTQPEDLSIGDLPRRPEAWGDLLNVAQMAFGGVEVLCFGSDSNLERAACFCLFAAFAKGENGFPLFSQAVVVLPPNEALGKSEDLLRERVFDQASALVPPSGGEVKTGDVLRSRVRLVCSSSLTTAGLLAAIGDLPATTIVLVVAASYYRDLNVAQNDESEGWTAHIAQIGCTIEPLIQPERALVLLDTGRLVPSEKGLLVLNKAECLSVCGVTGDSTYVALMASLDDSFDKHGAESALSELELVAGIENWERGLLKARYLARADRIREAFGAYIPWISDVLRHASGPTLVALADIARAAGQIPEATELVRRVNPERVIDLEGLEALIGVSNACGLVELRETLRARIVRLFPETVSSVRASVDSLLQKQLFAEIVDVLNKNVTLVAKDEALQWVRLVATGLAGQTADYSELLRSVSEKAPAGLPAAQAFSIRHATAHGATDGALLLASEPLLSDAAAAAALDALSAHFLKGGPDATHVIGPIIKPLAKVIEYLAAQPNKSKIRSALSHVLSPRVSGVIGVATLVAMLRERLTAALTIGSPSIEVEPVTPDELLAFHERLMSTFPHDSVRFAGADVLPVELMKEDLPRILSGYVHLMSFLATREIMGNEDVPVLSQNLLAGLMVARATRDEGAPADLIALAGGGLARFGYFQGARDLAEHMLSMVDALSSSPARRNAWRCYADLYQRVHNPLESLLGMTCAAFADEPGSTVSVSRFWNDVNNLVRTLRDLGFTEQALDAMLTVRAFLEANGEFADLRTRWSFLRCSMAIDAIEQSEGPAKAAAAGAYVADIASLIDEAIELHNDLVPLVSLAAQVVRNLDGLVPDGARVLQMAIDRATALLTEAQRRAVEVFMPIELEAVIPRFAGSRTRYSADLSTDLRVLSVAARSSLARAVDGKDVLRGLLSVECIAFHGATVRGLGEATSARSEFPFRHRDAEQPALAPLTDMLISSQRDAAIVVRSLAASGIDVHAVGIDSEKRAVRVSFYSARAEEIVCEKEFAIAALRDWSSKYPKGYSAITPRDPFGDDVARSLEHLGLSSRVGENDTALVLESDLQSLPVNLIQINGSYSGAVAPMTAIPSLSWLRSLLGREDQGHRRVAWFGDAADEDLSPLRFLRDDVEPILRGAGFEIMSGGRPTIGGAEIIILGAHGGIFDESFSGVSAFRGFSDERSVRLSLDELCSLVEAPRIMVLFACSAGRLDDMPFGQGLWGAPAALLRHGCRSVVASPWPLDVAVPGKWLPTFLARLESGDTVSRAAFKANHAVHDREPHPARWLAMHVYGDPRTRIDSEPQI